ncbi:MAG: hypothetical protein ABF946_10075, partial [Acetobacter papayae]
MRANAISCLKIASLLVLMTPVSACSSAGNTAIRNESSITVDSKIIDGKTTKSDIKKMFGDADSVDYRDKNTEIWKYSFKKSHYAPFAMEAFQSVAKGEKKTLTVLFERDIV